MKRPVSLLVCMFVLLPLLTACWEDEENSSGNDSGDGSSATVGSGTADGAAGGGAAMGIRGAEKADILAMAKKYYEFHSNAMPQTLTDELARDVGAVRFDGTLKDDERAEDLCTAAAIIAAVQGDGDYVVASTAAAVGWSSGSAYSANALASMLVLATFIKDKDRLADARTLAEYAISLDGESAAYYITLAQVRHAMGDLDGAIAALDVALALESDNGAALTYKLQLIVERGGGGMAALAKTTGGKARENDGTLGKRTTKLEEDSKGKTSVKESDSKEERLRKLNDMYTLEAVTPADMMEVLFAEQSQQLRKKIHHISEKDKLKLPAFPSDVLRNAKQINVDGKEAVELYRNWLKSQQDELDKYGKETDKLARKLAQDIVARRHLRYNDTTAADCMRNYNERVCKVTVHAYMKYTAKLLDEHNKRTLRDLQLFSDKCVAAGKVREQEEAAARKIPDDKARDAALEAARIKEHLAINTAADAYVAGFLADFGPVYAELKQKGEECFEKMLPFARCTLLPEATVRTMYLTILGNALLQLEYGTGIPRVLYYDDVTYADLQAAEAALAAAIELSKTKLANTADSLAGFAISVSVGPLKFQMSGSGVELEYVNGVAGRVAFNWKTDQLEIGIGAGVRGPVLGGSSFDKHSGMVTAEAKVYTNFVFQTRKGVISTAELTDVYVSVEGKGSLNSGSGTMEAGAKLKVSYANGVSLTPMVRKGMGSVGVRRAKEMELFP